MTRFVWFSVLVVASPVAILWTSLAVILMPASLPQTQATAETPVGIEATSTPYPVPTPLPTPTLQQPKSTRTPIPAPTGAPPSRRLPELYVDGPYLRRRDTRAAVWLKGVNVEEFRQGTTHTLIDLMTKQGLAIAVGQKWGINLLRVSIDPATVEAVSPEIDKLISFAQDNGMYVILVPFASPTNPARSELRMTVPDDLVVTAMSYLAARYKDSTNILYGLWNEPHPDSIESAGYDQQWQIWMQAGITVAQAIRRMNPKAVLVVPGGAKWARDLTYYRDHPFPFDNVLYDVHDYDAAPDYHYNRSMWTWAIGKYPLIIGEFGGNPIDPYDPRSIPYINDTLRIANRNPELVHYALYVLSNDGAWGLFNRKAQRMPKGNLLVGDLLRYPPSRFQ